jgi:hypothetical protein
MPFTARFKQEQYSMRRAGLPMRSARRSSTEPGLGGFPQYSLNSTGGDPQKTQKKREWNLTEFWILVYCREVGGALIRGMVY